VTASETGCLSAEDFSSRIDEFCRGQVIIWNHRESGVAATALDLRLCARFLGERGLSALNGPALLEFITWLRVDRNNSPASVNRKISSVKTYVRYLRFTQVEGAGAVPTRELPRINVPWQGPVETLSPCDVQRLFGGVDRGSSHGMRDFMMYSLMYRLGLRVGEVHALNVGDIDFDEQLLTVHGKGGKKRILPLVTDLPELLRDWLTVRSSFFRTRGSDALFISQKGNRMAIRTIEENFQKLVERTGPYSIERVTPHTLRHAFATHAIDEGDCNPVTLKAVLGHVRMSSTQIYLHPSRKTQRKAVNDHPANEILSGLVSIEILSKHQNWKNPIEKDKAA